MGQNERSGALICSVVVALEEKFERYSLLLETDVGSESIVMTAGSVVFKSEADGSDE